MFLQFFISQLFLNKNYFLKFFCTKNNFWKKNSRKKFPKNSKKNSKKKFFIKIFEKNFEKEIFYKMKKNFKKIPKKIFQKKDFQNKNTFRKKFNPL